MSAIASNPVSLARPTGGHAMPPLFDTGAFDARPFPAHAPRLAEARQADGRPAEISYDTEVSRLFMEKGVSCQVARNGELYAEDAPVDNIYRVESGVIRTCKILADGRRQIDGFYMAGDIVGIEPGARHTYGAEAVSQACVRVVRLRQAYGVENGGEGGKIARVLWDMVMRELRRSQEHILLLGRRSAQERVACFLLAMSSRLAVAPHLVKPAHSRPADGSGACGKEAGGLLELPMSRQDMADYLGLTIETVSRTFTQLEALGIIALPSARKVRLCNRAALLDMNG